MPVSEWQIIDSPSLVDVTPLSAVVDAVVDFADVAKASLEVAKQVALINAASVSTAPSSISTALQAINDVVDQFSPSFGLVGTPHILMIPAGVLSYDSLSKLFAATLGNTRDICRPQYDDGDFYACGCLLYTGASVDALAPLAQGFKTMFSTPNGAVRNLSSSISDAKERYPLLPVPTELSAQSVVKNGTIGVLVRWPATPFISTGGKGFLETSAGEIDIKGVTIYRSEERPDNGLTESIEKVATSTVELPFPGYEIPGEYFDTDVEVDKEYYYAAAYKVSHNGAAEEIAERSSGVSYVKVLQKTEFPTAFAPNVWASGKELADLFMPMSKDITGAVNKLLSRYSNAGTFSGSGATQSITDFFDGEIARINDIQNQIDKAFSIVDSLATLKPASSLGAVVFYGDGGNEEMKDFVDQAMSSEDRPELPFGGVIGAVFVTVSAESMSEASAAYSAIASLLGGFTPESSAGLDAALASITTAINDLSGLELSADMTTYIPATSEDYSVPLTELP